MPEWSDTALVLSSRPYGEDAVLLGALTEAHGRRAGILRGGQSRRGGMRGVLQPGNLVAIHWRARLEEHLGRMTAELLTPYAPQLLDDGLRLAGLAALAAICETCTTEGEPAPAVFAATKALVMILADTGDDARNGKGDGDGDDDDDDMAGHGAWIESYIRWEIAMLGVAGYGLQPDTCAVTGAGEGLGYVSPRSGAAVTVAAAGVHKPRLLVLPCFLGGVVERGAKSRARDLLDGLALTGYFLAHRVFAAHHKPLPPARENLATALARRFGGDENMPHGESHDKKD